VKDWKADASFADFDQKLLEPLEKKILEGAVTVYRPNPRV
jgi:hypothetical protein